MEALILVVWLVPVSQRVNLSHPGGDFVSTPREFRFGVKSAPLLVLDCPLGDDERRGGEGVVGDVMGFSGLFFSRL